MALFLSRSSSHCEQHAALLGHYASRNRIWNHNYTLDTFVCKIRAGRWGRLLGLSPIIWKDIRRAQTIWCPAKDFKRTLAAPHQPHHQGPRTAVSGPSVCDSRLRKSPEKRNLASLDTRPSYQPDRGRLYFVVFDFCKFWSLLPPFSRANSAPPSDCSGSGTCLAWPTPG